MHVKSKLFTGLLILSLLQAGSNGNNVIQLEQDQETVPVWNKLNPVNPPLGRDSQAIAYDPVNDVFMMYGGYSDYTDFYSVNETWVYFPSNNTWINMAPSTNPGYKWGIHGVYLPYLEGMMTFGGYDDDTGTYYNDTWVYSSNNNVWQNVTETSINPPSRYSYAMAYSPDHNITIMFGGEGGSIYGDTWSFEGLSWNNRTSTTHPSPRSFTNLVYDQLNQHFLLYGGVYDQEVLNDTWIYSPVDHLWTQINTTSAPNTGFDGLLFDPVLGKAVSFGGIYELFETVTSDELWAFDYTTSTWEMLDHHGPSARSYTRFAYDTNRENHLLFGGYGLLDVPESTECCVELNALIETNINDSYTLKFIPNAVTITETLTTTENRTIPTTVIQTNVTTVTEPGESVTITTTVSGNTTTVSGNTTKGEDTTATSLPFVNVVYLLTGSLMLMVYFRKFKT